MRRCRVLVALFAVLSVPAVVWAQPAHKRGWIDVNFGVAASGADEETFTFSFPLFLETAAFAAVYPKPSTGASFDVGGGYLFTPVIGVGISFTGTAHKDKVGLGASIPHPFFFGESATAGNETAEELTRGEGGVNIQAMFVPLQTPKVTLRVFGGPTYFRYTADMVRDVEYSQTTSGRNNTIVITGYEFVEVKGSGWGAHIGFDFGYFFSNVVGVGGFVRYSGGSVTVDEPMSEQEQSIKVGGFQTGGGLRLRF
jgi:hypothetical protein